VILYEGISTRGITARGALSVYTYGTNLNTQNRTGPNLNTQNCTGPVVICAWGLTRSSHHPSISPARVTLLVLVVGQIIKGVCGL